MASLVTVKPAVEEISSPDILSVRRMSLLNISEEEATTVSSARSTHPAIYSSYNDRIRPLLDVIDKLRHLKIMQEGIQLPTIVVVGDQSSGKSSVLESLAGISLPRGQGICTRVPLVLRLENHFDPEPEIFLVFDGRVLPTNEENISEAITAATERIAGRGKGISNNPLTLVVKKKGVPDLTMVDLPGITRVPVHGQPEDIYEQISNIIMEYITPEESVILNVLSASVDFTTCESIRMSQKVDKNGERTLAVVTKADKSPEGLLEKVTADDVNIGLGYVCVRNRIGDESYDHARAEEIRLFETHPLLSNISKCMVGIPVLAEKLVQIQASIIVKCLPDIVRKIKDKLSANLEEMNKMPKHLTSIGEAMTAFMHVLGSVKESLRKILIRAEFDEFPDVMDMHSTARLSEMLNQYSEKLHSNSAENDPEGSFLVDEIKILEETKTIGLPNFLPRAAFLTQLQTKVKGIYSIPFDFVEKIWNYVENVVIRVLMKHSENYPQLFSSTRRAAQNLIAKKKQHSTDWVMNIVEMEKLTDYTCDPVYDATWSKLMSYEHTLLDILNNPSKPTLIQIDGVGEIDVSHLRSHLNIVKEAFDLKMRMTAYWKIVQRRMVDSMALHVLFGVQNLINKEMETEIINELMGPHGNCLERMLEESPYVSEKRTKLKNSINLLKQSKDAVANIMDRMGTNLD